MNLPNYFLADLPPEAKVTAPLLADACETLKRNREQYLLSRSTESLVALLHDLGQNWLRPDYPFRQMALELGVAQLGFSKETLAAGLDGFFSKLTSDNLWRLLKQELGHDRRLDEFTATEDERVTKRTALARGPELIVQIAPGNIPNPTLLNIILGLLAKSAQLVKCASNAALLPRLFAHSIYEVESKLGACLEIAEWRGGDPSLEQTLFAQANCVIATGSDETLNSIRLRVPAGVRFLGHGTRVSFGYIANDAFSTTTLSQMAARAATDIVAWNQLGCLSPHAFYVEHGGRYSAEQFAEMLAIELEKRESSEPRGAVPNEASAMIATRRSFYEVRATHLTNTRFWFSQKSTAWSVIYEADPLFQTSCLHRFVYVKGVSNLSDALHGADQFRGRVSTVGLEATSERLRQIALDLARWGVTRICSIGQMQNPPLTWRHDGRPALGDLLTWTDWEQ